MRIGSESETALLGLRDLIEKYSFSPILKHSHKLVGESLFLLAYLDIQLISSMVVKLGFDLSMWNDAVMDRLFQTTNITSNLVHSFLRAGFKFSEMTTKRAIACGKPHILDILRAIENAENLQILAERTVFDLFGPYLDKDESLNVAWSSPAVSRIVKYFNIPHGVIESALLSNPIEHCTVEKVHESFPVTRPYLKSKPYGMWRWILEEYGPHHRLSVACFDDALSRAVADDQLHQVIDSYLQHGFVLRPRHIKIISCRILHRNMTGNALKVFLHLKKQLHERHRLTTIQGLFEPIDDILQIERSEMAAFGHALSRDVIRNVDWQERSRTVQLGSGHEGGTFRLESVPADVIRFTDQSTKLLHDIEEWTRFKTVHLTNKEPKPRSSFTLLERYSSAVSIISKIKS